MKFKHLKKVVSVLLSAALIATLFGCSSSSDEGNGNNASQSEENAEGIDMTFWIFLDPNSTEDPRSVVAGAWSKRWNHGIWKPTMQRLRKRPCRRRSN